MNHLFYSYLFAFSLSVSCGYNLPPYFQVCHRDQPDLNSCALKAGKAVLPHFAKGIPEIGMGPLDPLYLDKVEIGKKSSLKIVLRDTAAYGIEKMLLKSINIDLKKQHVVTNFVIWITLKGKYSMDGRILLIPLKGNGNYTAKIDDVKCKHEYDYKFGNPEKDDVFHSISWHELTCKYGKAHFNMENVFGDNKMLDSTVNKVLEDNWESLKADFGDPVTVAMKDAGKKIIDVFYAAVPFDKLLPK